MDLRSLIREIPDFPRPGISFKDATPLMADGAAFAELLRQLRESLARAIAEGGRAASHVIAPEARGFIFGAALAEAIGAGFVPARRRGKLPAETRVAQYKLEYGTDTLHTHLDALGPGDSVVVCDDLVATGGTAAAVAELAIASGAEILAFAFAMELEQLGGRAVLERFDAPVASVIRFPT